MTERKRLIAAIHAAGNWHAIEGPAGMCACGTHETCAGRLAAAIETELATKEPIDVVGTLLSAPSTRPIEWAILGVLLWILADVAAGSPIHAAHGDSVHDVFTLIGVVCFGGAFLRMLVE